MKPFNSKRAQRATVTVAAFLVLVFGLFVLRGVVVAPALTALLERSLAAKLGLAVSIERLGGTLVTGLEITGMATERRLEQGPVAVLEFRRLKLDYNPLALLRGAAAFLAGATVVLEDPRVVIDLAQSPEDNAESGSAATDLPSRLPRITVRNGTLSVKGADWETTLAGIDLTAYPEPSPETRIQASVAQWSWHHPALRDRTTTLDGDARYSAAHLVLTRLDVGRTPLVETLEIDCTGLPEAVAFTGRWTPAGGRLETAGRLGTEGLNARLEASGIDLAAISSLLASDSPSFAGSLAVRGNLALSWASLAETRADLFLHLADGRWNSTGLQEISGHLAADGRRLAASDVQLAMATNRIIVSDASAPAATVFSGDVSAILTALTAHGRLDAGDVPALLSLAGVPAEFPGSVPQHRLTLEGILAGGELMIPEGHLALADGEARLESGRLRLPLGDCKPEDATVAAVLEIDLPDLAAAAAIFALPPTAGSLKANMHLSGTLASPRGDLTLTARGVTHRQIFLGNLSLKAVAGLQQVTVVSLTLERLKDRVTGRGAVDLAKEVFKDVHLKAALADVSPYLELISRFRDASVQLPPITGALEGSSALSGPFAQPDGTLQARLRGLRVSGAPAVDGEVDVRLSEDRFQVATAEFRSRGDRLRLKGAYFKSDDRLEGIEMAATIAELADYAAPWLEGGPAVSGALTARLRADGKPSMPNAEAEIRFRQVRFDRLPPAEISLDLKNSGRLLTVEQAVLRTAEGRLELAGRLQRDPANWIFDVGLDRLTLFRTAPLLALEQPAQLRINRKGGIEIDELRLSGPAGRLVVEGHADPAALVNLQATAENLGSEGWLDLLTPAKLHFAGLDARLQVTGRASAPQIRFEGRLESLGSPDLPETFSGGFDLAYQNRLLNIRRFDWQSGENRQVELNGSVPLDLFGAQLLPQGPIELTMQAGIDEAAALGFLFPEAGLAGGALKVEGKLAGSWERPVAELNLQIQQLDPPRNIHPLPPGPIDLSGRLHIDGDRWELDNLQGTARGLTLHASVRWKGAPKPADVITTSDRKWSGRIDGSGELVATDLSWLAREVDGLRRTAGRLDARATVSGPIAAPAVEAQVHLAAGELAFDFDVPALQLLKLEARLTPQQVRIERLEGEMGGAPFSLSGVFLPTGARGPELDARLTGQDLLLVRNESLRLRADTDLTLKGPVKQLVLAGRVAVTDGRLTKPLGVLEGLQQVGKPGTAKLQEGIDLFSIKDAPLRDMRFDVRISAKTPFQVRNNLARADLRPDLLLSGTGELPLLIGTVYVDPSRLYLPAGQLKLASGLVRLDRKDPNRPSLDLTGNANLLGYEITAVITGTYDEPVIELSSVPPLPQEDLILLLLAGQTPAQSRLSASERRQRMTVAVFLGRDMLSRLFGGEEEPAGDVLERFDLEVGRYISRRGEETINAEFRLVDNVFRREDSLYLTGERDVFDYYNAGLKLVFRFR